MVTAATMKLRTKKLALSVLKLCAALPSTPEGRAIRNQLVRSGTAVGANYRAACRARTTKEFAAKLGVAEEEADESLYWIELAVEGQYVSREAAQPVWKEMNEVTRILVASIRTVKTNTAKGPVAVSAKSAIRNPQSTMPRGIK
jgi:four helix bundle protein